MIGHFRWNERHGWWLEILQATGHETDKRLIPFLVTIRMNSFKQDFCVVWTLLFAWTKLPIFWFGASLTKGWQSSNRPSSDCVQPDRLRCICCNGITFDEADTSWKISAGAGALTVQSCSLTETTQRLNVCDSNHVAQQLSSLWKRRNAYLLSRRSAWRNYFNEAASWEIYKRLTSWTSWISRLLIYKPFYYLRALQDVSLGSQGAVTQD